MENPNEKPDNFADSADDTFRGFPQSFEANIWMVLSKKLQMYYLLVRTKCQGQLDSTDLVPEKGLSWFLSVPSSTCWDSTSYCVVLLGNKSRD
jgi:hypothetical protein